MFCIPFPKSTDFRFEQLWNAPSPMASMLSGIVICSILVQPASKLFTILAVPASNITFLRVAQLINGPVTLQLDVSQPVKDLGISMLVMAVPQKEPEPSHVKDLDKGTLVRELQLQNASVPMDVTLFGIVIEVKLIQFAKALASIVVTELGIVTEVMAKQLWKTPLPMATTGYPPRVSGMTISPCSPPLNAVIVAWSLYTVYV